MISRDLKDALQDAKDFNAFMEGFSFWARHDPDRPKNYVCLLGKEADKANPQERDAKASIMHISDEDGLEIDGALTAVKSDRVDEILIDWILIMGHDVLTVAQFARGLKRAMRQAGDRFSVLDISRRRDKLIERTRLRLLSKTD